MKVKEHHQFQKYIVPFEVCFTKDLSPMVYGCIGICISCLYRCMAIWNAIDVCYS